VIFTRIDWVREHCRLLRGNSIESIDLGFALQARCLEAVARGSVDAASCAARRSAGD